MTLKTRLALWVTTLLALSVALSAGGFYLMESATLKRESQEKVRLVGDSVARAVEDALIYEDRVALLSYMDFLRRQWPALEYARAGWEEKGAPKDIAVGADRPGLLRRDLRTRHPKTGAPVDIQLGFDPARLEEDLRSSTGRLKRELTWILLALVLFGGAATAGLAAVFVRPLKTLSEAAQRIGQGRLGERMDYGRRDELGKVVEAFNLMSTRLEELDGMKRDFVAATTHELRSPLAAIESLLGVLAERLNQEGSVPQADLKEYLDRVRSNVRRLGLFVDNLLDAAKIERGKMEVHPRPTELKPLAVEVVRLFEAKYAEKGVRLREELPAGLAALADPAGLDRVLVNLVANALKFTPSGGTVTLAARRGSDAVEVRVADTGVGIHAEDLKNLFQKFSQGRNVREIALGRKGTGLGLYVVRSIVEAHGGKVGVESKPGEGTTFLFTLKPAGGA